MSSYSRKAGIPPAPSCKKPDLEIKPRSRHPAALDTTSRIIGHMGLTGGLPNQFHWEEHERHTNHASEDYANYFIDDEACIPQNYQKTPIIGEYEAMVKDDPFSPLTDQKINSRLAALGFGLLLGAGLLYSGTNSRLP